MNGIKNIGIALLVVACWYGLSLRYQTESSVDNTVYQHIQKAEVAFLTYLEKDRAAVPQTKTLSTMDSALMRLDQHLKAGERLAVLAEGEVLLDVDPSNLDVLLRQGIVYLQQQEYALAYEQLTTVHQSPTPTILQAEAAWYLALLQAQQGNWSRSQAYLQDVLTTHTPYRRSAEELLDLITLRLEA